MFVQQTTQIILKKGDHSTSL